MSRRVLLVVGILVLMGLTSAASVFGYITMIGGSGKASQPISAPTLDLSTLTPDAAQTRIAELSTRVGVLEATNRALSASPTTAATVVSTASAASATSIISTLAATSAATSTATPTVSTVSLSATGAVTVNAIGTSEASISGASLTVVTSATSAATADAGSASATGARLYRIVQNGSKVSFTLTEDLMDEATTVVGETDQIAGEILVDFATPANSKIGGIRINARTLATDNEFRNKAIRAQILESSKAEYEFIDFTPQKLQGLPSSVTAGQPVTFQVVGLLKVRDITKPVTFDITVKAGTDQLEGHATATVTREQFNLQIPDVPGVANVSNDVALELTFVALPAA